MNNATLFVFALIGVAGALMASNRVRFDVVALLVVLALMLSGVLSIPEALAGFGSPVVIMVAGLLVIGEMLSRTGVARAVGDWILKHGVGSEARILLLVMVCAALLGSVASSSAVVALFIPLVLRIGTETGLNTSRLLIPLSYAALISGMLTLISTAPNLVVHEALKDAGFAGFHFFSFTPLGLAVLAVGIVYILVAGRHLLGGRTGAGTQQQRRRTVEDLWLEHSPGSTYRVLRVADDSPLDNRSIGEAQLEARYKIRIVGVYRQNFKGEERIAAPSASVELSAGTTLVVVGKPGDMERMARDNALTTIPPEQSDPQHWLWDVSGATILIHPDSQLLGKSLRECEFRSNYGVHVLGVRRNFKALDDFEDTRLQTADSLFVVGHWQQVQHLSQMPHDFVVMELPREHTDIVPSYNRMGMSLLIVAGMVMLTLLNIVPLVPAVLMAALAAILTRCLTMEEAYRAINWGALVLIAGMLPLADALQKTGGTRLIADGLMALSSGQGPYMLLSLLFFLTAGIGLVLSNTAAAVLVAPIAIQAAATLGISPYPLALAVIIAASASFATPVATPVVSLVVEPGRYRFQDFLKVGLPLLLLAYLTTLVVAPLLFPF